MAGYGKAGVPDIIGCWRGMFFGIEVKASGRHPTPLQIMCGKAIEEANGEWFFGTYEEVKAAFETYLMDND